MFSNNTLSRRIPGVVFRRSKQTTMLLSMALFSFLFMIIFRPFGIHRILEFDEMKSMTASELTADETFYVMVAIITSVALLLVGISRFFMVRYSRSREMTYSGYLTWNLCEFLILAVTLTGFSSVVFHSENILHVFLNVFGRTFCILLIPYGYSFLYIVLMEKMQVLKNLRESIRHDEESQNRANVLFHDDKGLRLSVKRDNLLLIESADNYVCVWYLNNDTVKKAMVRNTMKRVAEQLGDGNIRRCHRSYMVNLDRVKVLRREKEGIFIEIGHDGVPDIPISKTYAESITSWLMK